MKNKNDIVSLRQRKAPSLCIIHIETDRNHDNNLVTMVTTLDTEAVFRFLALRT